MDRRRLLSAAIIAAASPTLLRPALAQGTAANSVPSQMSTPAGAAAPVVATDPDALGIPADKRLLLTLGAFSKGVSQIAVGSVQSPALREFATLEIAEQDAVAAAFGFANGPLVVTPEQARELEAMRRGLTDDAYLTAQLEAHASLLAAAQGYASTGEDPMARGAAIVAVPGIQSHVAMLQLIRATL